ncbi:MAG: hypothetical protein KA817_11445 [Flavobacteriales bacterium]|jgi:hypothetical protein|nr:hypothetical protein [Flavobacteriales bacterium]
MFHKATRYAACLWLLACVPGCRKEVDDEAPTVRILSPAPGSIVQVPATVTVTVAVNDERSLSSLVVSIADADGVPVAPSVLHVPSGRSQTVELELSITDEQITSGTYQLIARASDGTNDARAYSALTVLEASLRTKGVLIAPRKGVAPATIMELDDDGNVNEWGSLPDMGELSVIGHSVFATGSIIAPLQRREHEGVVWTMLAPNGTQVSSEAPFFHGLRVDPTDGRTYVGQVDGIIRGYSATGDAVFNGMSLPGHQSRTTVVLDDRLMSAALRTSDGQWSLVGHSLIGGEVLNDIPLDLAPVRLVALGNDRVLVFGQDGNGTRILSLHVLIGGPIEHAQLASVQLRDVVTSPANDHFLALSNGIMRYRHSTFTLEPVRTDIDAHALAWDPVNGVLYAAAGNSLLRLDPATWATIATWNMPFDIGDVEVVLDR